MKLQYLFKLPCIYAMHPLYTMNKPRQGGLLCSAPSECMDMLFEIMAQWPRCQHVIGLCNRVHTGFLHTQRTTLITATSNPFVSTMAPMEKWCAFTFYLRLTHLVTDAACLLRKQLALKLRMEALKRLEGYMTRLQGGLQGEYTSNPLIPTRFDTTSAIYNDDSGSNRADRKTSTSNKLEMELRHIQHY